jgi:trigger factor
MDLQVEVEKTGSYLCKLSVSIPVGDVNQAFDQAVRRMTKQAQLPGFRQGKIPRTLIEKHFGPQIRSEVQNQLVEDSLFRAIDDKQLAPVAMPRLQLGDLTRDSAFSYTAEVEVRPDIELKTYEGLAAPAADTAIEEGAIDSELEAMQKQAAQTVPVLVRDTVQDGDIVLMDYEGSVDGVPFNGGKAENALVEIGGSGYIPGFAEGLVGAKVPSERDLHVTFPTDYSVDDLKGKAAVFKANLKELKTRELPKLDDEFAKDMGEDSLEALRTKLADGLKARKERDNDNRRRRAVLAALVEANPFEVPPSMVEGQTDRLVASAAARVERMVGQRLQLNAEQLGDLRDNSRADALFQVQSGLLMVEVAKKAGLEVSAEEIDAEVEKIVEGAGEHAGAVREMYVDAERREDVRFRLLEDKVVKHLLEHSVPAPEAPEKA